MTQRIKKISHEGTRRGTKKKTVSKPTQLKIFAGSRGGFYKKRPWPPEAKQAVD